MRKLPAFVHHLCYFCDGWIVGSSANPRKRAPRDWDIIIPYTNWGQALAYLKEKNHSFSINSFGGLKVYLSPITTVDIWPGDVGEYLKLGQAQGAWHHKTNTRITKEPR